MRIFPKTDLPNLQRLTNRFKLKLKYNLKRRVKREKKERPVSRFAMIESSPNLAFLQMEEEGTKELCSKPKKSHDRVVWSFKALFRNTDTTSGCSRGIKTRENELVSPEHSKRSYDFGSQIFLILLNNIF